MADIPDLTQLVIAAGALGAASFGIVEGLKSRFLGGWGFDTVVRMLGPLREPLKIAYGPEYEALLRAQYRKDRTNQDDIARTLRQGVRVGLTRENASECARFVGSVPPEALVAAVEAASQGAEIPSEHRNVIGRFELAVDARIDSALALAKDQYLGAVRGFAYGIAIVMALFAGFVLHARVGISLVVGVAAVPIAPITNDIVAALQAATKALKSGT
jgi:hypothetical protein